MPHPHVLRDIALFVEVAKRGSFSQAAIALDMPISSLSRRITLFESEMGLRLIERTTRKVALTPHGETYLPRAARIVDEAQRSFDEMAAQARGPSTILRLMVPDEVWVLHPLSEAIRDTVLPEHIGLHVAPMPQPGDTATERYDLAIIVGQQGGASPDRLKIAELERGLYASDRYLQAEGVPAIPQDLARHSIILDGQAAAATWRFSRGDESVSVTVAGRVSSGSAAFALRLASAGIGIAAACVADVESGRLVRVLPDWDLPALTVSVAVTSRALPVEARGLIDRLAKRLGGIIDAVATSGDRD